MLPEIADNNLIVAPPTDKATAYWTKRTAAQDLTHADMADAQTLNEIIWFSVRGDSASMPAIASLPAFDLMIAGLNEDDEEEGENRVADAAAIDRRKAKLIAALRR